MTYITIISNYFPLNLIAVILFDIQNKITLQKMNNIFFIHITPSNLVETPRMNNHVSVG